MQPSLRPHWGLWGMCLCFLVRSFPREAAARGSPPDLGGGCSGRGTAPLSCLITWSSGRDAGGFQSPCPTPIPPHSPPTASVPPCPPSSPSTHVPSRPSFPSCCVLISDLPADLKANAEFFYSRLLNPASVHPGAHCTLFQPFYMFDIFHHKELENINSVSMLMKMIIIKTSNHDMVKNILATKSVWRSHPCPLP